MDHYPIRYISQHTGLTADCIRAWEKRYQAISPKRQSGQRLYSNEDLRRLQLLKGAIDAGCRISQISSLPDEELIKLGKSNVIQKPIPKLKKLRPSKRQGPIENQLISEILTLMKGYQFHEVSQKIKQMAALSNPESFIERVVLPLLEQVGLEWEHQEFSIAQEHFLTNFLGQIIGGMFNFLPTTSGPTILFATPSGHRHEFGLLSAALISVTRGYQTIYLGCDIPVPDILSAANELEVFMVVLAVQPVSTDDNLIENISNLKLRLKPGVGLCLGGPAFPELIQQLEEFKIPYLYDLEMFKRFFPKVT